ncbi:rRNA methylase [Haloferula helveola]|uniref:rRNA methylase n=1 Tax=Haloferula helveola TaxID=490095 RepID=A0ABM7RCL5_9BACT|nr:rRNA methylase [Haloferula helveola]
MGPVKRPTQLAHEVIAAAVGPGDTVVDATAGNGHDTLFLARLVGQGGKVVAFDIQEEAVESTRRRLGDAGMEGHVTLHRESHTAMTSRLEPGAAAAVMFNLGYLPGGDHALITEAGETIEALEAAMTVLRPGGLITVVCYPGHAGGDDEAAAVVGWAKRHGGVLHPQAREGAPFLVVVERRS